MRSWVYTFAVTAALAATPAWAELRSSGTAEVALYLPGGTGGHAVRGKSDKLVVSETGGVVTVTAYLDCIVEDGRHTSCIQTGIALRDAQMWKYLEAGTFQKAVLSVERNRLRIPSGEEVTADAVGKLAVHGVERQVSFHYLAARVGNYTQVNGKLMVNLNDFNIERPSFFGVHTGTLAQIRVRFTVYD